MASSPSFDVWDSSAPAAQRQDPYLRLHSVTIFVRDQDRSLRFYLNQLGFTLVGDVRFQTGRRWVAVSPPNESSSHAR